VFDFLTNSLALPTPYRSIGASQQLILIISSEARLAVAAESGRVQAAVAAIAKEPAAQAPVSAAPLRYRLQTFVPWNWYPMLPVTIDLLRGEIALEQGRMRRPDNRIPEPVGRILATAGTAPYRIREESVPRVGARVVREGVRSRWTTGDTHFWIARRKLPGRGEGSSGLRYDVGEPNKSP
jgi:hypothetical protein